MHTNTTRYLLPCIFWGVAWATAAPAQAVAQEKLPPAPQYRSGVIERAADGTLQQNTKAKSIKDILGTPSLRQGHGSGIAISRQGHIITNEHVVRDCKKLTARASNGDEFQISVIGRNHRNDLALLQGKRNFAAPAVIATTANLRFGQQLYVIGYPAHPIPKLTPVIRAMHYAGKSYTNQRLVIDGKLYSGDSGGGFFTRQGQLVGLSQSTLDIPETYRRTQHMPKPKSFIVPAPTLHSFLQKYQVPLLTPGDTTPPTKNNDTELFKKLRQYSYMVRCWR